MHKIIPVHSVNQCIICYDNTLNKNCCIQCKSCILCKKCLQIEYEKCPLCRRENFKNARPKLKNEKKNYLFNLLWCLKIIYFPFTRVLGIAIFTFVCFALGTFVRLMSGDLTFRNIDILLNCILGMVVICAFMFLFICMDICLLEEIRSFIKFVCCMHE